MNALDTPKRRISTHLGAVVPLALAFVLTMVVGLAGTSLAAESASEKANIKLVNDFMASWDDPDKAVTYLSEAASVRMVEDQPPLVGRAATAAAFKGFMTPGMELLVETLSTTVYGPVVVNKRIDTIKTPGKPDQVYPLVGVFLVRDGKIAEWVDYLEKPPVEK